MIEALSKNIWSEEQFQADRNFLQIAATKKFFDRNDYDIDFEAIKKLLQSATCLALSESLSHRQCAYEIAVNIWKILSSENNIYSRYDTKNIASVVSLIFTRLGNFPADSFFTQNVFTEALDLPFALALEREGHKNSNKIKISDAYTIYLTDAQKVIWDTIKGNSFSAISAPTSAGKSFVFQNYIVCLYSNTTIKNCLYIVPTRALIAQVTSEISNLIHTKSRIDKDIDITEVPRPPEKEHTLYILTQERAQILLENKELVFDFVIVDEIQSINDKSRGVILQSSINDILRRGCKNIVFGAPYASNIEVLFKEFNICESFSSSISNESAVLQNLIYLDIDESFLKNVNISIDKNGKKSNSIFSIQSNTELVEDDKILSNISYQYGKAFINIIYGSEPSKCEKIARSIRDLIALDDFDVSKIDTELVDFSKFLKAEIHKDYLLADYVLHGVAYHYGRLPSFIRKGIEHLFNLGKIKYLVCTSTLLQGVNLPAQNIFLLNPSKGQEKRQPIPLDSGEFWNLVGRAGRLTKDFDGNIFLINSASWITSFDSNERTVKIDPAFSKCVTRDYQQLYNFITRPLPPSGQKETLSLETSFMKIYCDLKNDFISNILPEGDKDQEDKNRELIQSINSITQDITLPISIVEKNKSVSVLIQNHVYMYFVRRIKEKGASYLIPKHPLLKWGMIIEGYKNFFYRIHKKFMLKHTKQHEYIAPIALIWMRGTSYSEMLKSRIDYRAKQLKRKEPDPNIEARALFKAIEDELRFTYVKFSKCYNDLLHYALEQTDNSDFIKTVSPIHLYLELGASSLTMISLIALGLSRTAAAALARIAPKTDMDSTQVIKWLKSRKFDDLPRTIQMELLSVS